MKNVITRNDMPDNSASYTTQIALVVPVRWKQRVSELAKERTIAESRRITVSDLIREALDEAFILSHINPVDSDQDHERG